MALLFYFRYYFQFFILSAQITDQRILKKKIRKQRILRIIVLICTSKTLHGVLKKTAALLLSALLCFNWYGYRLITDYLQYQADLQLEVRLDNNDYDESQLIELRIPLHLPYHNDWSNYERYDGEIEFRGAHYKYVKRKIEKGDLVLLCLPDHAKQRIRSARELFFQLVNDLQQESAHQKTNPGNSSVSKYFFSDYREEKNNWTIMTPEIRRGDYKNAKPYFLSSGNTTTPEQPPEYLC